MREFFLEFIVFIFLVCLFLIFIRLPGVCLAVKPNNYGVVQTKGGGDHYTDKIGFLNF